MYRADRRDGGSDMNLDEEMGAAGAVEGRGVMVDGLCK